MTNTGEKIWHGYQSNLWSNGNNWSTSATIPQPSETAIFDSTVSNNDCLLDVDTSINGLSANTYTGSLNLSSYTLSVKTDAYLGTKTISVSGGRIILGGEDAFNSFQGMDNVIETDLVFEDGPYTLYGTTSPAQINEAVIKANNITVSGSSTNTPILNFLHVDTLSAVNDIIVSGGPSTFTNLQGSKLAAGNNIKFIGQGNTPTTRLNMNPTSTWYQDAGNKIWAWYADIQNAVASGGTTELGGSVVVTSTVSTFAGTGSLGDTDGAGTAAAATFDDPYDVALDSLGNMYVADRDNNKIRKITPAGVVSTFAGTGSVGSADGVGTAATFNTPTGVALDSSDNVYVADRGNHKIRKITPAGVVSTLAGDGTNNYGVDGVGTAAGFRAPEKLTLDASGNIYVADRSNQKIRKITPAGVVSTLAGTGSIGDTDGLGTVATFDNPTGIALDSSDNIYVAERSNNKIRKMTPSSIVSTLAGTGSLGDTDGLAASAAASFNGPGGVALDSSDNIYVVDPGNAKIRKITPAGVVSTLAGDGSLGDTDGAGASASFNFPRDVVVDASGNVYVAEYNHKIRKITPAGVVSTLAGTGSTGSNDGAGASATFENPQGIVLDSSDNVYVADMGNNKIRKITPAGVVSTFAGSGSTGDTDGAGASANFDHPRGLAIDSSDNVYVADRDNHKIRKITPAGVVSTLAGTGSIGDTDGAGASATFSYPDGVALDSSGNVYVGDLSNNKIRKITPAGVVSTFAGTGVTGDTDGPAFPATFNRPRGVDFDSLGNMYVADTNSQKIRKISTTNVVSTFAGTGSTGSNDGVGTSATFYNPFDVVVDSSDNIYVADGGNRKIRKITPSGVVSTFAGTGSQGSNDGAGASATFNYPDGMTIDSSNNIYVTDSFNNKIRKITPSGVVSTFAGTGATGSIDGAASTATFNRPSGITLDSSGNIYVADNLNNKIRKITPAGDVSTFAGSGTQGDTDGTGTAAEFNSPDGLAVDTSDNIYVVDYDNHKIRKITPSGVVSTFAGTGTSTSIDGEASVATFDNPHGIHIDSLDNIYVVGASNKIRKITPGVVVVSTLAGTGSYGSVDGPGASASFRDPSALVVDSSGNLYVAEYSNHKIRKITPSGVVSTLAGSGSVADIDGVGTAASFSWPTGITLDSSDNVYVADSQNNKIRKTTPSGVVSTFAGTGATGSIDGAASTASFRYPRGIAQDSLGNLYVSDNLNKKIRKITPAGDVSTFAGSGTQGDANGTGTAAEFDGPAGIVIDSSDNLYIADTNNNKIRKITPAGEVTTFAGTGTQGDTNGSGTTATFDHPWGIALDSLNNLYVADRLNNKIRKITPVGEVSTFAGASDGSSGDDDGTGTSAKFNNPYGIILDSSDNVYVADTYNNKIRKITPAGVVSTFAGDGSSGDDDGPGASAEFNSPRGMSIDSSNNIYVVDVNNRKIRRITPSGVVSSIAGDGSSGDDDGPGDIAEFSAPRDVVVDSSDNILYVADYNNNKIRKLVLTQTINSYEDVSTFAGPGATGAASTATFDEPFGIDFDSSGNMYVADSDNNKIRKITPAGVVSTLAGSGSYGDANGPGTSATFRDPKGVVVDASGNVYVADTLSHKIRKITPVGEVTTFAGTGSQGSNDGTAASATFKYPHGIILDSSNNIYVADERNHKIRKITPSGDVTTFAGSGTQGDANGTGTAAEFSNPHGLAIDSSDNIYVGDLNNHKIRKITPAGVVSTIAGTGSQGDTDGPALSASFYQPDGLAIDSSNNIYVAEASNRRIRMITPSGTVITIAGDGNIGSDDGAVNSASFAQPRGLAIDSSDNIYVADRSNDNIRKLQRVEDVSTMVTSATGSIVINQLVRAEGADGTKGLTERRNTSIFGSTPENEFSSTDNAYHQTFTSNNVLGLGLDKRVLLATVYPTNTSTFAWRIDNDPHMRMLQWSLLNVNAAGGSSDTGSFAKVAYQRNLDIKTHFGANYFNFGINDNPLSYSTTLTPDENQQQLAAYLRVLLPPKLSPQTEGELLTDDEFNTVGSYTYQGSTAMGELVTDFVNGRVRVQSRDDNSSFESDSLTFQHGYDANHGSLDIPTSFFDQNPGQEFVQYNTMQLPSSTSSNGYRWITKGLYNPEYVVNAENNTVQTTLDSYEGTSSAFKSYLSYYFITDAERENNAGNRYVPGELNPVTDPSWEFSVDNKQSFIKFLISNDEDNVLVNDVRRSFWDSYYTIPEGEDRQIQNIFQINNTDSVSDITQFHGMYWLPFARIFSSDYEVPPEINITDIDDYASIIGGAYPNVASTLGKSLKSNPIAQRFYEDGYDESFVSVNTNNVTNVALEEFLRNYINGYSNLMPYRFYNNFRTIITSTDTPTQNNQDTSLNQITTEMDVDRIYKFTTRDYLEQYSDVPPSSEIGRYIDDNFTFTQDGAVASTVIAEDYNPAWMYFDNGNPTTDPENSTIKNLIVVSGQNYIADREFYREKMLYNYTRVKLKFVFSRKSGRWMTLDYRQVPTSYLTPTIGSVALDEKEQSVFVSNKTENTLSNYVQSIVPKINTIYDVTQLPSNDGIFDSVTFISNSDTPIYSVAEKVMLYVPQHVTELNSPQDPTLNIYSVVDSYGDIVDVGGGKYSHTIELNDALNTLLEISNLRIASQLDTIVEGSYPFNNVTQGPNIDFIWNRDKCQDSTNLYRQLETTPYYLMEPNELNRGVLPYMSPSFPYDANGDRVSELNPEVDSTGAEDYRFQRLLEPQKGAPDGINYVVPNNIHGGSIDADENLFLFQPHTWTTYWHIRPCVSCMEGTDIPTRTAYTSGVMADPVLNNMFTWPDPRNIQYAIPWHKDMAQSWFNNGLLIIDAERVTFNGCNSLIIDAALSDPENVPPRFPYDIYDADRYTLGL